MLEVSRFQKIFLFSYFASTAFENLDPFNTGGYFSVSKFAGILYLMSVIPNFKFFFTPRRIILTHLWSLLGFTLLLTTISIVNINEISFKIIDTAFLLNLIMSFIMISHILKDETILDKALYYFSISCVFMSFLGLLGIGTEVNNLGRVSYFGSNENEISIKLSAAILIIIYFISKRNFKIKNNLSLFLSIPLLVYSTVSTGSRSGFLVLLLGIIIFYIARLKTQKNKLFGSINFLFSLGISIAFFLFFALQSESLGLRLVSSLNENDLGGREVLWLLFFNIISENYLFGLGYSGYIYELTKIYSMVPNPHNVFLEVLLYSGIVGLILFCRFILRLVKISYNLFQINYNTSLPLILLPVIFIQLMANQALTIKFFWIISSYIIATHIRIKYLKNKNLA